MATAMAQVLTDNGHEILLWSIDETQFKAINELNINPVINYSKKISNKISATIDLKKAVTYSDTIIIAVPSFAISEVIIKMLPLLTTHKKYTFINVAKGLIPQSGVYLHNFFEDQIPAKNINYLCSISGPSYALEILNRQITHLNITSTNLSKSEETINLFNNYYFKLVSVPWVAEMAFLACYKNVIALFAGIMHGFQMKNNSSALFFVQALSECRYLFKKLNFNPKAIYTYGGIGDLILTCSSAQSRNYQTGVQIATSNSFSDTLLNIKKLNLTVEGIGTALALKKRLRNCNELSLNKIPLLNAVWQIIHNKPNILDIVKNAIHPNLVKK